jgi:DNA-binding SARP family transcriptional activator
MMQGLLRGGIKARLRVLGRFAIELEDGAKVRIRARKSRALLAYLALQPDQTAERELLATLLWGNCPDHRARHSLRQCLVSLRSDLPTAIADDLLILEEDCVRLRSSKLWVDAQEFAAIGDSAGPASLDRFIDLYRGPLLADISVRAEAFEEWLRGERSRLEATAARVFTSCAEQADLAGDGQMAINAVDRLTDLDPLREDWHRLAIRIYARYRGRDAALALATRFHAILKKELNVSAEVATLALVEEIRSGSIGESHPIDRGDRIVTHDRAALVGRTADNTREPIGPPGAAPSAAAALSAERTRQPITKRPLGRRFAAASAIAVTLLFIAGCWIVVEYFVISTPNNPAVRPTSERAEKNQPSSSAPQLAVSPELSNLANAFARLPQDHIRNVAVAADEEVRADYAINVDRACHKGETPTVQVTGPPGHGSVAIRNGDFIHRGPRRFIDVNCPERILPGVGIYYKPNPGFHGTDAFSVRMVYVGSWGTKNWDGAYIVSVR